ncbi:MAG: LysR family transcriptional regulator [Polyangiaceae bacterium]
MDRLHELQVFVAVAESGGFAKAGKRLRLSPPAVTRAVAALEGRLGTRVFQRTTRRVSLTDAGARFLESSKRILEEIEQAELAAAGEAVEPSGRLTLSTSMTFGRAALTPIVCDFLAAHPRITARVLLQDRVTDLVAEGIDLAVRLAPLPDSTLVARRLGEVRRVLIASPSYLKRHGVPRTPQELRAHTFIGLSGLMPHAEYRYVEGGKPKSLALSPRLEVDDSLAAIQAVTAGHGISVALSYQVAEQLQTKCIVTLLDGYEPPRVPVHLVYPQTPLLPAKVRAFVDFAVPRLQAFLSGVEKTSRKRGSATV